MRELLGIALLLATTGCSPRVIDIVVHSGSYTIVPEGIRFELEQPLYRKRRALSIMTAVDVEWRPESPWKTIKLSDGRNVAVVAELEASDGTIFRSTVVGCANNLLDLRFKPPPPKEVPIKYITLRADVPLRGRNVRWYEFNAL
ncbi:MAG: hypothetical protein GY835_23520 [bacterium]|nr:hypothetical protein [bacterium]